ncbi:LemA family protein [Ligilactobacillus acidipiscis]|uniref:LemA family protein n=1 Tax=Ligilactobacillus acidipiscis TaxID=89059 RepID=UPI002FD88E25
MGWTIIIVIVAIIAIYLWSSYNKLQRATNSINTAEKQIDVQLKYRADLIPNVVETVKGYATHEQETFTKLTEMRSKVADSSLDVNERSKADQQMSHTLGNLFAVAENYPDLKASTNFLNLQEQLTTIENKVAAARQMYNKHILFYNNIVTTFPSNLVAKMFNFSTKPNLEVITDEAQREAPQVKF